MCWKRKMAAYSGSRAKRVYNNSYNVVDVARNAINTFNVE